MCVNTYLGDPSTPGYPSYPNATRTAKLNTPSIPSIPISWNNARHLLSEIYQNVTSAFALDGEKSGTNDQTEQSDPPRCLTDLERDGSRTWAHTE